MADFQGSQEQALREEFAPRFQELQDALDSRLDALRKACQHTALTDWFYPIDIDDDHASQYCQECGMEMHIRALCDKCGQTIVDQEICMPSPGQAISPDCVYNKSYCRQCLTMLSDPRPPPDSRPPDPEQYPPRTKNEPGEIPWMLIAVGIAFIVFIFVTRWWIK